MAIAAVFAATAHVAGSQAAGFTFDWAQDTSNPTFSGTTYVHADIGITGTPFLYELVTGPSGVDYYHMIIGAPSDGFAEEVYIRLASPSTGYGGFGNILGASDSGGVFGAPGNGGDPLGVGGTNSGNASGNPLSVQMHMILNDGEMSMEFLKDDFNRKPVITQQINAPDITSAVIIDMRNSTYSDMNTPGIMLNTMSLQGPDVPPDYAQFDMAKDAQNSNVNAGRYTYSSGTYNYLDGGFNADNVEWGDFFDPTTSNPWAYSGNKP